MVSFSPLSVLAHLPRERGCAVVRDGDAVVVAVAPDEVRSANGDASFAVLDDAAGAGFWIGYVAYDLGRAIERIPSVAPDDTGLPDVVLARYDARLVLRRGREPEVLGDGPTASILGQAAWRARRNDDTGLPSWHVGLRGWQSSLDRDDHARAVEHVLELLRAGECYQVNLTRRLTAPATADPVALFGALTRANPAPHAALLSFGAALRGVAIVSASPELFLRVEGRMVETRPVKGTAADADVLAASAKDAAENIMIVDLARNDLGRVCEYGTITVPSLCAVESHPGLHHLVSTVRGTLRKGVGLGAVVRATFPPASVTGAPKPRVLRAIEELEPVRRGVYCGAIGWIDGDTSRAELAVAIRTFVIDHERTHLGVGGGVVADSTPDSEWRETELKAARLLHAAGGGAIGSSAQ